MRGIQNARSYRVEQRCAPCKRDCAFCADRQRRGDESLLRSRGIRSTRREFLYIPPPNPPKFSRSGQVCAQLSRPVPSNMGQTSEATKKPAYMNLVSRHFWAQRKEVSVFHSRQQPHRTILIAQELLEHCEEVNQNEEIASFCYERN